MNTTTYAEGIVLTVRALRSLKSGTRGYAVRKGDLTTGVVEHVDYHGHKLEYVKLEATAPFYAAVSTTLANVTVLS